MLFIVITDQENLEKKPWTKCWGYAFLLKWIWKIWIYPLDFKPPLLKFEQMGRSNARGLIRNGDMFQRRSVNASPAEITGNPFYEISAWPIINCPTNLGIVVIGASPEVWFLLKMACDNQSDWGHDQEELRMRGQGLTTDSWLWWEKQQEHRMLVDLGAGEILVASASCSSHKHMEVELR